MEPREQCVEERENRGERRYKARRHAALLHVVEGHERRLDDVEQYANHHVVRASAECGVVRVRAERRDGALQLRRAQLRHQ